MAEQLHAAVKPFDHKPEKRGPDGKIVSARYYGTHIVGGVHYHYFYDDPGKFYHTNGEPIPYDEVPAICKRNINKKTVPKPNDSVIIKSKKAGESETSLL